MDVAGLGPKAATQRLELHGMDVREKQLWIEGARIDAIVGNCRLSLASVKSGIRCYIAFAGRCLWSPPVNTGKLCHSVPGACGVPAAKCFPPEVGILLAWAKTFRCARTYRNYLGYVKTGSMLLQAPVQVEWARDCTAWCAFARVLAATGVRPPRPGSGGGLGGKEKGL